MTTATRLSPREYRLRKRIDDLTDDRDKHRGAAEALRLRVVHLEDQKRPCILCGFPTRNRRGLCIGHSDLASVLAASGEARRRA